MKTRLLAAIGFLFLLCGLASAQDYDIRVTSNTNLRAAASLQASIVETAPAGTTLNVVGSLNRWLQINRNGGEVWMADWVGYEHVEKVVETAPTQPQTTANIDNCWFVDRQCMTDQEWVDGYWAFQNGQCTAPTQTQTQTSTQVAATVSSQVNNCCFLGWQCNSDAEWSTGFHAYRNNQCKHPAVAIEGSATFVALIEQALDLLKTGAPNFYTYATTGLDRIREVPESSAAGVHVGGRIFDITPVHTSIGSEWLAATFVHEACHVHRYHAGLVPGELEGERACLIVQIEAQEMLNPDDSLLSGIYEVLENIENPEYQWWH